MFRWVAIVFVIALGALLVIGGFGIAPELIVVDAHFQIGASLLGALMIAAGMLLRPNAHTIPPRRISIVVHWLASAFLMALGGYLIAGGLGLFPLTVHADAAVIALTLGIVLAVIGFAFRPT